MDSNRIKLFDKQQLSNLINLQNPNNSKLRLYLWDIRLNRLTINSIFNFFIDSFN